MTILRKKYNLCSFLEQSGSSCPLSKGTITLTWGTTIPSSLPPVRMYLDRTHTHSHAHSSGSIWEHKHNEWQAHGTILLTTNIKRTPHLPFMDNVHRPFNYLFATFNRTLSFFYFYTSFYPWPGSIHWFYSSSRWEWTRISLCISEYQYGCLTSKTNINTCDLLRYCSEFVTNSSY